MIAADPHQGGATWAVLQYVLGFQELGHEVFFVEPIPDKPLQSNQSLSDSENARYFSQVASEFGFLANAALLREETHETVGIPYEKLKELIGEIDMLVNVSGMLTDVGLIGSIPIRVYLDLDPGFIQIWQSEYQIDMRFAAHTHFVTVGQGIGTLECPIPTCGLSWLATWQPIVLAHWPIAGRLVHDAFTTIANWRGYGSVEYRGLHYGQKAHSWRQFFSLPKLTGEQFSLALAIHPGEIDDIKQLVENDWRLLDPQSETATPASYQAFIQGSKAELGIAKSGYVVSQSGWLSDRSVCYLASGRPVLAQETGFSKFLPTGEGLLTFQDLTEAEAGVAEICGHYKQHRAAARALAVEYFDSKKVLTQFLIGVGAQ